MKKPKKLMDKVQGQDLTKTRKLPIGIEMWSQTFTPYIMKILLECQNQINLKSLFT